MANVLNVNTKAYLRSVNTPEYSTDEWLINPDMSNVQGVPVQDWVIEGGTVRQLNNDEKAALLPDRKYELEREVAGAASDYGAQKFPVQHELKLKLMYQQAVKDGLVNRAAYIGQALQFEYAVVQEMQSRVAEVRAITTWEGLSVSTDFSNLDVLVPDVTVAGAMEITD